MAIEEVTQMSWFSRLGNAFKGVLAGVLLVGIGVVLLFWNEGRTVHEAVTIDEGRGATISVACDTADPANEGALVHLGGEVTTTDTLIDPQFRVSARALKLQRDVEMYQWKEKKKTTSRKVGRRSKTVTTYSYERVWSSDPIRSDSFKESGHNNPPNAMPWPSHSVTAPDIFLGVYRLPDSLVGKMRNYDPIPITEELRAKLSNPLSDWAIRDGAFYKPVADGPTTVSGAPEIGDLRIRFSAIRPGPFSLIARQIGETFEPYTSKVGNEIFMVSPGTLSAEAMFDARSSANITMNWLFRLLGFGATCIGFGLIFAPLSVMADVIPFLGDLIGVGVLLVALVLGTTLSLVVIAVAWIVFRPVLGIILLLGAAAVLIGVRHLAKKMRATHPSLPPGSTRA